MLWLYAITALAHPYHTTRLEISHAQGQNQLLLSLRMLPEDVEQLASLQAGKVMALHEEADVLAQMGAYLPNTLKLHQHNRELEWQDLEMEWDSRAVWFYFRVMLTAEQPEKPVWLHNRLLLDLHPDALNTVILLQPDDRYSRVMNLRHPRMQFIPATLRKE